MTEKPKRGAPKGAVRAPFCSGCGVKKTLQNTYTRQSGPATGAFANKCKKCDHVASVRFNVEKQAREHGGRKWLNDRIAALTRQLELYRIVVAEWKD